ncbi:MAG: thioredoxin family protein [Alphaproteobacteria bacterium]|nr:thioredoxin family protein [Alphaproteobacteria bacterium]
MWWMALAFAEAPRVEVRWRGPEGTLHVVPPAGAKVSGDAPVDVALVVGDRPRAFGVDGDFLHGGLPLGDVRDTSVEGTVDLQICEDDTGICRPETLRVAGRVPATKKGTTVLGVELGSHEAPSPFNADAAPVADAAFAAARASGGRVLLDFSAVWCPPCNLLAAEVLHADDAETALEGLHVAVVDVDHPSSWTLKDRYAVGSYPTVVVTDADGGEIDRVVGYPGREPFLAFLAGARGERRDWAALDPSTLSPDDAATGLVRLLDSDVDLGPWLAASAASDTADAHLGRFRHAPTAEGLSWLVEHHPERSLEWVPFVGDWLEGPGREPFLAALPAILASVRPGEAADVLWFAAQLHDGAESRALFASAASILSASLTGDFAADRGYLEFLATLLDRSGEVDAAIALLDRTAREHPDEPTFFLAAASHLNEHERYAEALRRAELAMRTAWGDNRLRVATEAATALMGLDRADEARSLARKTLEEVPAPDASLKVRTHRYREKLAKLTE